MLPFDTLLEGCASFIHFYFPERFRTKSLFRVCVKETPTLVFCWHTHHVNYYKNVKFPSSSNLLTWSRKDLCLWCISKAYLVKTGRFADFIPVRLSTGLWEKSWFSTWLYFKTSLSFRFALTSTSTQRMWNWQKLVVCYVWNRVNRCHLHVVVFSKPVRY